LHVYYITSTKTDLRNDLFIRSLKLLHLLDALKNFATLVVLNKSAPLMVASVRCTQSQMLHLFALIVPTWISGCICSMHLIPVAIKPKKPCPAIKKLHLFDALLGEFWMWYLFSTLCVLPLHYINSIQVVLLHGCICAMHCNLLTIHTRGANHGLACVASVRCTKNTLLRRPNQHTPTIITLHLSDALKIRCYRPKANRLRLHSSSCICPMHCSFFATDCLRTFRAPEIVASVWCTLALLRQPTQCKSAPTKHVASARCTKLLSGVCILP